MQCDYLVDEICLKGHNRRIRCCERNIIHCRVCADEDERQEKRRVRDEKLDNAREQRQCKHAKKMAEMQDEMDHERRLMRDGNEDVDRVNALRQQEKDLLSVRKQMQTKKMSDARAATALTSTAKRIALSLNSKSIDQPCSAVLDEGSTSPTSDNQQPIDSPGKKEWDYRKSTQGHECNVLDELMDMIGLEDIKDKFLSIKDNIDTSVRQNVDLGDERFSASLVGNPGTGKLNALLLSLRGRL